MEHTTFWMFYQMLIGLKISNILLFTEAFANVNRGLRKKRKKKTTQKQKMKMLICIRPIRTTNNLKTYIDYKFICV